MHTAHTPFTTLALLALTACGAEDPTLDTGAAVEDIAPISLDMPMLQAAADTMADAAWGRLDGHGNLALADGTGIWLFGDRADVERILAGGAPRGDVAGVVLDPVEGTCAGVLASVPGDLAADLGGAVVLGRSLATERGAFPLEACPLEFPARPYLEVTAAQLNAEWALLDSDGRFLDSDGTDLSDFEVPTCSDACGASQGYSYAGQAAYSNGAQTGSGNACGGTGTYGYLYQCVEYTERVAGRSDWAGNAYTGYWSNSGLSSSSSSQGPYYKGLLPLGNGTGRLAPQAGDVVVWQGGSYGHVGVIASVGSSTVTVYDQNRRCADQMCTLGYGSSYTLSNGSGSGYCGAEGMTYTIAGYLHRGWDFGGYYGLASSSSTGASTHNWWLNDASYVSGTTSGSVSDITDYITINPGASDPYMTSPAGLKIPAYSSSATHGYRYVSFRIQSNCTNKTAKLYWKRTTDSGFAESRSVTATITGSGWQDIHFNAAANTSWSGTIDQIRIDPATSCSTSSSDTISMQYAWFWR